MKDDNISKIPLIPIEFGMLSKTAPVSGNQSEVSLNSDQTLLHSTKVTINNYKENYGLNQIKELKKKL